MSLLDVVIDPEKIKKAERVERLDRNRGSNPRHFYFNSSLYSDLSDSDRALKLREYRKKNYNYEDYNSLDSSYCNSYKDCKTCELCGACESDEIYNNMVITQLMKLGLSSSWDLKDYAHVYLDIYYVLCDILKYLYKNKMVLGKYWKTLLKWVGDYDRGSDKYDSISYFTLDFDVVLLNAYYNPFVPFEVRPLVHIARLVLQYYFKDYDVSVFKADDCSELYKEVDEVDMNLHYVYKDIICIDNELRNSDEVVEMDNFWCWLGDGIADDCFRFFELFLCSIRDVFCRTTAFRYKGVKR